MIISLYMIITGLISVMVLLLDEKNNSQLRFDIRLYNLYGKVITIIGVIIGFVGLIKLLMEALS